MKNKEQISRYLSYILRHNPESIGLKLDTHGWVDIDLLIDKTTEFALDKEIIKEIVKTSSRQRFGLKSNKIRANQGHSVKVDLGLQSKNPPRILYHGTATRFLDSIMMKGLLAQQRQYVHLSENIQTAKEVGQRYGEVIVLEINSELMDKDGYIFYLSENNVWLTEHVPTKYISVHQG